MIYFWIIFIFYLGALTNFFFFRKITVLKEVHKGDHLPTSGPYIFSNEFNCNKHYYRNKINPCPHCLTDQQPLKIDFNDEDEDTLPSIRNPASTKVYSKPLNVSVYTPPSIKGLDSR